MLTATCEVDRFPWAAVGTLSFMAVEEDGVSMGWKTVVLGDSAHLWALLLTHLRD